jgi:hypothetical protein
MPARGEPHEADALCPFCPPAANLGAQRFQRHWVPDVERIAEHARGHACIGAGIGAKAPRMELLGETGLSVYAVFDAVSTA